MAATTEEGHPDDPSNTQPENMSPDIITNADPETISPNQETENMEVRHHPNV